MLTDAGGTPIDGARNLTFRIYDDTTGSGTLQWSETQSGVQVNQGLFNVVLGKSTALNLAFDKSYWLEIEVEGNVMPRIRFTSVGYAYRAQNADTAAHVVGMSEGDLDEQYVNVAGPDSVRGSNTGYPMLLVNNYEGKYSLSAECYWSSSSPVYGTYSFAQNSSSGMAIGGHFQTSSAGTGYHIGVLSESSGASSTYIDGISSYSTNNSSGEATAGYFNTSSSGSGEHYGVYAESHSTSVPYNHCVGVYGSAENTSSGWAVGGEFYASPEGTGLHCGIWADAYGDESTDAVTVVDAFGQNASSADVCAGHFEAASSGTGTHYGVYCIEAAGGDGAAVYAAGDYKGSGTKYAVVKTSEGHRCLSVIESPEIWFEDFGEGQLTNGRTHIELDPLFLETVTINAQHPMKVFVQVDDENCKGTAVKRGITGFDVIELNGGMSNSSFSYRVVAKRKGYETERLRETDVGYDDPTLYPELRAEMEKRHEERKIQHELRAEKRRQQEERIKEGGRQTEEGRR